MLGFSQIRAVACPYAARLAKCRGEFRVQLPPQQGLGRHADDFTASSIFRAVSRATIAVRVVFAIDSHRHNQTSCSLRKTLELFSYAAPSGGIGRHRSLCDPSTSSTNPRSKQNPVTARISMKAIRKLPKGFFPYCTLELGVGSFTPNQPSPTHRSLTIA